MALTSQLFSRFVLNPVASCEKQSYVTFLRKGTMSADGLDLQSTYCTCKAHRLS